MTAGVAALRGRLTSPATWAWVLGGLVALLAAASPLLSNLARQGLLKGGSGVPLLGPVFWLVGFVAIVGHHIQVDAGGNLLALSHPAGSDAWWGLVQTVFFPVLGACWVASVAAQVLSYRRSSGERRLQLKWLVGGSAIAIVGGGIAVATSGSTSGLLPVVGGVALAAICALPVSMGVAILKYRLFDIDRILSRTLAYAIVTGLLVGVYAGLVTLASLVLTSRSPVTVAIATLAAAALFNPVRRRVQRIVDHRFNRARYNAERTVAAFTARLQDAVDLDEVRHDLLAAVQGSLEPAHASIWLAGSDT